MKKRACTVLLTLVMIVSVPLSIHAGSANTSSFTCKHNLTYPFSAPDQALHDKCEGIIAPFNETDILQLDVQISVRPVFWMCMVDNYDFIVDCRFTFTNPTADPQTATLAFPFSTHDIYGDHEEFETITIFEGDNPVSYSVALNSSLYSFEEDGLYFKGDMINYPVHPLLEEAYDMAEVAPRLYGDEFEMVAFWDMMLSPGESKEITISFTHYSGMGCCYEDKNRFVFDVTNAEYWNGPIQCSCAFLKTLRYETISTSLDVTETPDSYLLTGTDLGRKIDARVLGGLLSRGCVVRRMSAICQSGACAFYLEPDPGYEGYWLCDFSLNGLCLPVSLDQFTGCHVEVIGRQGWCSVECGALIVDDLVVLSPPVTLTVQDTYGMFWDTVAVTISLENQHDIEELRFSVQEKKGWLTFLDVLPTDRTAGLALDYEDTLGAVSVSMSGHVDSLLKPGEGPIVQIVCEISPYAVLCDSTSIEVSDPIVVDENDESHCVNTDPGRFLPWYCPTIIKGDLNLDCVLDIRDAILLVNYILFEDDPLLYPWCILDCNGDGIVDIGDVLRIIHCILGMYPSTGTAKISPAVFKYLQSLEQYLPASDFEKFMALVKAEIGVPTGYSLSQNYPNPFNPSTDIRYQIADGRYSVHTTLKIHNILGQEVRMLVDEVKDPGYYTITWDGKDSDGRQAASGVYFYRLTAGEFTATKRMVLMK